jgi:hypothetical protein
MNNYLGPLPGPWKGPMQVRDPEASDSLVVHVYELKGLRVPITFWGKRNRNLTTCYSSKTELLRFFEFQFRCYNLASLIADEIIGIFT